MGKFWNAENSAHIQTIKKMISEMGEYNPASAESMVHEWIKSNELPMGQVMNTLRLALVGESKGVSVFDIIDIIGVNGMSQRIDNAVSALA